MFGPICGEIKSSRPNNPTICWWDLCMADPDFSMLWKSCCHSKHKLFFCLHLKGRSKNANLLHRKNIYLDGYTVSLHSVSKFILSSNALSAGTVGAFLVSIGTCLYPFLTCLLGLPISWIVLLLRGFDSCMLVNLFKEGFQQWVLVLEGRIIFCLRMQGQNNSKSWTPILARVTFLKLRVNRGPPMYM